VRLDRVHKHYDGVKALNDISLEIREGESVAVMGPSGCGKSTLLNLIAGLDRPTSGRVHVAGYDFARLGESALSRLRARHIGVVFQFFNLVDDLSALDNVVLPAQLVGMPTRRARNRAHGLLDELGMAERADSYPRELSGGERQVVSVARALMNRPVLLLADEPTGALDSRAGERVTDLLIDLNEIGLTLVVVTHNPQVAARCARRLVELGDGRVVREGGTGVEP